MTFSAFAIAAYILAAIIVAIFAIRILRKDAANRRAEMSERSEEAKLAEVAAKAYRNNIKQPEDGRTTYGNLPVIEVTEMNLPEGWDEDTAKLVIAESAMDNVIIGR